MFFYLYIYIYIYEILHFRRFYILTKRWEILHPSSEMGGSALVLVLVKPTLTRGAMALEAVPGKLLALMP